MTIKEFIENKKAVSLKIYGISDNQTIVKNKRLIHIAGNVYFGNDEGSESMYLYFEEISAGLWYDFCYSGREYEKLAATAANVDFVQSFKAYINHLLELAEKGEFIKCNQIDFALLHNQVAYEKLHQARQAWNKKKAEKEEIERLQRIENDNANIKEKNDKARAKLQIAFEKIQTALIEKNTQTFHFIDNEELEFYTNRYDHYTTTIFEELAKIENIKLPIKLIGWIRKSLGGFYIKDGKISRYKHSGNASTTFFNYANQLKFEKILSLKKD